MSDQPVLRRISSYGRNRGRKLGPHRDRLEKELLPTLLLDPEQPDLSGFDEWRLEIGFGAGEHLAMQAETYPDVGFIGCEPYITAATVLLRAIEGKQLNNIRLFNRDARELMEHLPDSSLSKAYILFPDPWPKLRHHKRRLVNHDLLDELHRLSKPGAELLLATDHEDYLTWMLEHIAKREDFKWQVSKPSDWLDPPKDWAMTKYQAKALREGRVPHWLSLRTLP